MRLGRSHGRAFSLFAAELMNASEAFVTKLCTRSFLSLWTYPNPRGKGPGKELCDILVACEPDILIFSVKEIIAKQTTDSSLDYKRWRRRAIEKSVKQIYKAERWIAAMGHVVNRDGKTALPFPDLAVRRIHRVAVAFGSQGKFPLEWGDFGKGFVHVFDERSLTIIMQELDTVSDFVKYLSDKEFLYSSGVETAFAGGEEDLLAVYLHRGRQFPDGHERIFLDSDLWAQVSTKPEFLARKSADKASYIWDRLIERFCQDLAAGNIEFGNGLPDAERAVRVMARENRFSRRIIGKAFKEFIDLTAQRKIRARRVRAESGVVYVFLARPHDEARRYRIAELAARCFVARGLEPEQTTVVGIATEEYTPGGFSLDLYYLQKQTWSSEDKARLQYLQEQFGYFANSVQSRVGEDEYPEAKL